MGYFDSDYNRLSDEQLAVRIRQARHKSWLHALLTPVKYLRDVFMANRADNLYVVAHSSQVCRLEAVLNDAFDATLRRIYIDDGLYTDSVPIYTVLEDKDVYIGADGESSTFFDTPLYIYTEAEAGGTVEAFRVMVPSGVVAGAGYDEVRLRALVDKYRLASRNAYLVLEL